MKKSQTSTSLAPCRQRFLSGGQDHGYATTTTAETRRYVGISSVHSFGSSVVIGNYRNYGTTGNRSTAARRPQTAPTCSTGEGQPIGCR
jgi:hypothetical protein